MLPELSLLGRTAIVTGAGRGIGRAISLVLAEAGADVVVAARTTAEIESVANEVRAMGRQALAIPTDVSQSSSINAMVEETVRQYGKVDILVNNAGQILRAPVVPFPDVTFQPPRVTRESNVPTSDNEWQSILDANLNSVFYGCRAVASHMLERRYGKIINVSSNNGTQAFVHMAAYNASKAAVNMLTRVLALEWADYNICVNAIGPGDYNTALTEPTWIDPVERQRHLDGIPMHREGDLRELGVLAVYLAGAASDYMSGQIIYLDGAQTAK
jgi:NAD(P)-dependent dehydrogenase (short-subunit alcohol dehydrogenase family)